MAKLCQIYCVDGRKMIIRKRNFSLTNFQDNLQFTPAHRIQENPIIVHLVEVNPVDYAMASIIGAGLRDKEITQAFTK